MEILGSLATSSRLHSLDVSSSSVTFYTPDTKPPNAEPDLPYIEWHTQTEIGNAIANYYNVPEPLRKQGRGPLHKRQ